MANRIAGLDIGTYAVKAVVIELQRQIDVVDYREIPLSEVERRPVSPGVDGSVQGVENENAPGGNGESAAAPGQDKAPDPQQGPDPQQEESGEQNDAAEQAGDWAPTGDDDVIATKAMVAVARLQQEGFFEEVSQVITSFPDGKAVTLHLEVPFERPKDVAEILPHLLMDELPVSLQEVVYDFIVVPGRQPEMWEALVGFVNRRQMGDFLDECQDAGVDPAVVGVPELMLRYAGDQGVSPGVDSYAIIDVGHEFTRLLIMAHGKPVVVHTTHKGGATVTRVLAENFQIPEEDARRLKEHEGVVGDAARGGDRRVRQICGTIEEALRPLVRDLRRTFQSAYAKYGVAVEEIYITGGTSRLHGLSGFLQREFEVPVKPLRFDHGLVWSIDARSRERIPEATLALGSALQRPLDDSERRLIDFRQQEFVFRGKSSYLRTQLVRLGAVAALLVVMLAGVLVMQHYDQRTQMAAMQKAVAEQTEQLFGEPVSSAAEVQARLEGEATATRDFIPKMSAYELLVRIIEMTSSDIELELDRIEVDTDRSLIQMMGTTDSPQSVDVLASQIEDLDCLRNVQKDQVNVQSDEKVQFELQISSACS